METRRLNAILFMGACINLDVFPETSPLLKTTIKITSALTIVFCASAVGFLEAGGASDEIR